ncbi:MAG: hypothetical protein UU80_C0007G0012 [candidate division WWE3 bacterium GW2011_GWA1_41_8]|uniref:Uncharacterized protein n=2 Tax=Katanobacteria TaxID=422282 RepID=A0A0G1AAU6_UNCKA|nr:MAG: hypothetical protein UU72_C0001G0007 [candidate division WWE3 bacterium GW2011_GWB1_41_6]KKS22428.1 MAG: hypothetical protein UU80_C0007G0012 [candidate division WWE3 bacterium GW2011_GWA1_41_8]
MKDVPIRERGIRVEVSVWVFTTEFLKAVKKSRDALGNYTPEVDGGYRIGKARTIQELRKLELGVTQLALGEKKTPGYLYIAPSGRIYDNLNRKSGLLTRQS